MLPARSIAPAPHLATAVAVSPNEPRALEPVSSFSKGAAHKQTSPLRNATRWLLVLFVISLALINPWVRGDGVGYYAFARAVLIQHNLDFTPDYNAANASFRDARLDENGNPKPVFHTVTNHLENHFTVGPAILWAPFLIVAHVGVLVARSLGSSVTADGFSAPYRFAMASGNRGIRIPRLAAGDAHRGEICWRAMGVSRDGGDLVGEFAARVYVFQSVVVACAFCVRGGAVPLVLARNARRAEHDAVDSARRDRRADAQRLLSECDGARGLGRRGIVAILCGAARKAIRRSPAV